MSDEFQPMPDEPTPSWVKPPPVIARPLADAPGIPIARPVTPPVAAPSGPGIVDLLLGVAIVWAIEFVLEVSVGVYTGVSFMLDGIPPDDFMNHLGSMAWLFLPVVLVSNLGAVCVCWYFMCRRHGRSFAEGLALQRPSRSSVALAFVLAVTIVAGFYGLTQLAPNAAPEATPDENIPIIQLAQGGGIGLFALFAVIVAPLEEIYYRGFLYPLLRRYLGPAAAIPIVSVWFTAIHAFQLSGAMYALVPIFMMSLAWTIIRETSGSLWPSIVCHVTYNGSLMVMSMLDPDFGGM